MQNPRVLPSGGVFSTPKVNYSKETQDFVNLLMKEAHLSNTQRRGFASILRSGDPLPNNPNYTHEMLKQRFQSKRRAMCQQLGLDIPQQSAAPRRPRSLPQSGRRSLQQIMASGVYDPTPLPPSAGTSGPKKEDEIARLQHKMAYGTQKPEDDALLNKNKKREAPMKEPQDDKESRFAELIDEIADRIDFLNSMHEMGRDKGYRSMMEYQIREKLSELEKNYPREVTDVVKHFGLQKFMSKIEME